MVILSVLVNTGWLDIFAHGMEIYHSSYSYTRVITNVRVAV